MTAARLSLVIYVLPLLACATATAEGGSDASTGDAEGGALDSGAADPVCTESLASGCAAAAQSIWGPCVATFDQAHRCSSWSGGLSTQVVESCGGYHVVHRWNVEPHELYFYDLATGALVAIGGVDNDGLRCFGGPRGLALPPHCWGAGGATPCVAYESDASSD